MYMRTMALCLSKLREYARLYTHMLTRPHSAAVARATFSEKNGVNLSVLVFLGVSQIHTRCRGKVASIPEG